MKKYLMLICAVLCVSSCSQGKKDYVGSWSGSLLVANVEYIFTKNSFETRTLSIDGVLIDGKKGKIKKEESGVLFLSERQKYVFDTTSNTGSWQPSENTYALKYSVTGGKMKIEPFTNEIPLLKNIDLQKK